MTTNATAQELQTALQTLNAEYNGNISFNRFEPVSKTRFAFTLKAVSKLKGARTSGTGRNMPKASWHVHGKLFDILFSIRPDIYILSFGQRITKDAGNWQDRNVGSMMCPVMMSQTSIED